ncbi:hypothetical protein [Trinickia acidisoli]|uniref:hypothetical protein n=1 Tax=Trinickia acidisoli TaxID=2767482 RepID=UPI001A8DE789|nr:hypothetical protein [Trinickia acidisoli]
MLRIPVSRPEFYGKYFEKQHYHASNIVDGPIFAWSDLDDLLFPLDPKRQDDVKIILGGRVAIEKYSSQYQDLDEIRRRMTPNKLGEILKSGATMVINRLDLKSRKIATICQWISDLYDLKTMSLYTTWPLFCGVEKGRLLSMT